MALKDKIIETLVLGGVSLIGQKVVGAIVDPILSRPADAPALPPASSLSGYKVTVDNNQAEGFAGAITRGIASAFGVPTAPPAYAYPPPAAPAYAPPSKAHEAHEAHAHQDAPLFRGDAPQPRKSCCSACRSGKPCCGTPDTALGSVSDDDVDEDDVLQFLSLAGGFDSAATEFVDSRLEKKQKEYEAKIAALQAAANKTDAKQQGEIAALQAKLDKVLKAQSRPRLKFGRPVAPARDPMADAMSQIDKLRAWLEKNKEPAPAPVAPAPVPVAPQPIIVTAPWGAPAPVAPAPVPVAPQMVAPAAPDFVSSDDPFQNVDLLAMLATSGFGDQVGLSGVDAPKACPARTNKNAVFPDCGC